MRGHFFFENFTQVDIVILAVVVVVVFNIKSTVVRTGDKQNAEYCKTCVRPLVFTQDLARVLAVCRVERTYPPLRMLTKGRFTRKVCVCIFL